MFIMDVNFLFMCFMH